MSASWTSEALRRRIGRPDQARSVTMDTIGKQREESEPKLTLVCSGFRVPQIEANGSRRSLQVIEQPHHRPRRGTSLSSRRDEIVSIARGIFATRGFKNTSMRDIAEACGLLAGSLYSHFRSKSEILILILDPFYDQLIPAQEAAAVAGGSGADRTEDMLRRVFVVLARCNEEMGIIHYDWQDLVGVEEFEGVRERSNLALELWHQVITDGIDDGTLRAEIDPEITVRVITSSLHGVLDPKRYGARPNPLAEDGFNGLVDQFVLMMLSGLRPDNSPPDAAVRKKNAKSRTSTPMPSRAASTRVTKSAAEATSGRVARSAASPAPSAAKAVDSTKTQRHQDAPKAVKGAK